MKMNNLTQEEQQQIEQLELQIAWIKEQFPVQIFKSDEWYDIVSPPFKREPEYLYRRKPKKKVVPLEASDIDLHRDLFTNDGGSCVRIVLYKNWEGIVVAWGHTWITSKINVK